MTAEDKNVVKHNTTNNDYNYNINCNNKRDNNINYDNDCNENNNDNNDNVVENKSNSKYYMNNWNKIDIDDYKITNKDSNKEDENNVRYDNNRRVYSINYMNNWEGEGITSNPPAWITEIECPHHQATDNAHSFAGIKTLDKTKDLLHLIHYY